MRILVTGASGFIGGRIVEMLAKNQTYQILATGRSPTSKFIPLKNVTYFEQDLNEEIQHLTCEVCIHCAGLADDRSTQKELILNNVLATENLLTAVQHCNLFIYISSSSVYDFSDGKPKCEDDTIDNKCISPYGRSKLEAESIVSNSNIKSIYILRPRAVYGEGDRVLLPRILRLIKWNRMFIPGNLSNRSSLTHIENLCEAVEKSLLLALTGVHIYNIADKVDYNLNVVFREIMIRKSRSAYMIKIPEGLIKFLILTNKALGIKGQISSQSYKYISEPSQLNIDKAVEQLNYRGNRDFFESLDQLNI